MFEPARELARAVAERSAFVAPGILHPHFVDLMRHAAADSNEYLVNAKDDHAPLSDLRLRRDLSSKHLLHVNLQAFVEFDPEVADLLGGIRAAEPLDHATSEVKSAFTSDRRPAAYNQGVHRLLQADGGVDVFVALVRYVNAFGSWEDAGLIARAVSTELDNRRFSTGRAALLGMCGVVLALNGDDGADSLLRESIETHSSGLESFFMSLRFASILAKRRGDLDEAHRVILRGREIAVTAGLDAKDASIVDGMTGNFLGLLAVRTKDFVSAGERVQAAVRLLPEETGRTVQIVDDEALRYSWMARLNQAQLLLFSGRYKAAEHELRSVVAFARQWDHGALHTSLSTLGFCLIRDGRPHEAIPELQEALVCLRNEYDLTVVEQVRKLLFKALHDVGDIQGAQDVVSQSPYYWRHESNERNLIVS
jgi:hypothetical protein